MPAQSKVKFFSFSEIERLFRCVKGTRNRAMFELGFYRALRASEVGLLQLSDYRRDSKRLFVHRVKGSISAEYPLLSVEMRSLNAWIKERGNAPGAIFLSRNGRPISQQMLDVLIKKAARLAGLPPDRAHWHTLRHSCAMWLLENDRDLAEVQDHLGHASISNTVIYAKVSGRRREKMAQQLDKRDRRNDVPEE